MQLLRQLSHHILRAQDLQAQWEWIKINSLIKLSTEHRQDQLQKDMEDLDLQQNRCSRMIWTELLLVRCMWIQLWMWLVQKRVLLQRLFQDKWIYSTQLDSQVYLFQHQCTDNLQKVLKLTVQLIKLNQSSTTRVAKAKLEMLIFRKRLKLSKRNLNNWCLKWSARDQAEELECLKMWMISLMDTTIPDLKESISLQLDV